MTRAAGLADSSVVIDIATTDYQLTEEWRATVASLLPPASGLHIFPEGGGVDAGWSWKMLWWVRKNVQSYDVVHIHAMFSTLSSACAAIARRVHVPYILRPLGTLSPYTFANRKRLLKLAYFRFIDKSLLQKAFAVHYTAEQEAEKAGRLHLKAQSVVIPIPISNSPQASSDVFNSADVLFLSRLHPKKGLDLLIPAFAAVAKVFPKSTLVVAGSGDPEFEHHVHSLVAANELTSRVRFEGFVEGTEKARLFSRSALFVLPSYEENFGVAIVEALAVGLPVVITKGVDIWRDVLRYGSGVVTDFQQHALEQALMDLLGNPWRRTQMGEQGQRQVKELYSPETVGRQLVALYTKATAVEGRI
jgi:glycosyltransferase involved in cell wall biosynthesis